VKINATVWLCEKDDHIHIPMALDDLAAPPFKIGDVIHLDVEELYPKDYEKYKPTLQERMIKNNDDMMRLLNRKSVVITEVHISTRFNTLNTGRLTYEYYCIFTEE